MGKERKHNNSHTTMNHNEFLLLPGRVYSSCQTTHGTLTHKVFPAYGQFSFIWESFNIHNYGKEMVAWLVYRLHNSALDPGCVVEILLYSPSFYFIIIIQYNYLFLTFIWYFLNYLIRLCAMLLFGILLKYLNPKGNKSKYEVHRKIQQIIKNIYQHLTYRHKISTLAYEN